VDDPTETAETAAETEARRAESQAHDANVASHEARNVVVAGLYDIVIRIGWIFKTESVIMPAFLDQVAGAGWLRGLLPVVNRFGMSIPPTFYAPRLRRMPVKKGSLALWTLMMALVFLTLAGVWYHYGAAPPSWMATVFLMFYATFSSAHGINQLSYSTVQGKLLTASSRGRLMSWSLPVGATLAVVFAWWLMGRWLSEPDGGFVWIFGFTGVCFVLGSALSLLLREPPDRAPSKQALVPQSWFSAVTVLRHDANFRRFAYVAMLSSTTVILFPHYQALARQRLGLSHENLMIWVVVQNLAVGAFGLVIGRVVHRRGERLAVRLAIFGTALAPATAVWIASLDPAVARQWFWLVFIPIGMTPISQKTMQGYTLEASPQHEHPRYLSTLSLAQAVPFLLSPLVGWLVDRFGFEPVFLFGSALLIGGGLMTLRIAEPREQV
jgi:hypothetical protein